MSSINNHGNTPAAWATTVIVIIGSVIAGIAIPMSNVPVSIAGFVIVALGALVGLVMKSAGFGRKKSTH
jgi:hypothetical protein